MTAHRHRSLFLNGPAGRLEALLWVPQATESSEPSLATVVCHPHPLYGGTLHNKVVFQAAKTLDQLGAPVLRFNFRGAGKSEGTHDHGRGEGEDVRAALAFLAGQFPRYPLLLAGFSFGAWVGLRIGCEDALVTELVGLGLPVNDSDFSYLRGCSKPKLFIQGGQDQYGSRERFEALVASLPSGPQAQTRVIFVPGADHFFSGKLDHVDQALRSWLLERHPELAAQPRA